jgi:glycosyltransferase involved in cell wall biosynthesis
MPLKNLLIVTYHFPPSAASGSFRLLGFSRHLPRFQWRTTVVAPPDLPWEPVDSGLRSQVPSDTVIHEVPYPRRAPKLLRWAAPHVIWLPRALAACRRAVRHDRVDAVLTSGPPHWAHLAGLYLKRKHGLPWLADFRDPWISQGPAQTSLGIGERWQRYWEAKVMTHADLILANAPNACATARAAYPDHAEKIITLTNGYDPDRFPNRSERTAAEPWRIVHAGELYLGRHPGAFLDAVRDLKARRCDLPDFHVSFLGRSSGNGIEMGTEVRRRGLEQIVDWGRQVSYRECLHEMVQGDILLLLDTPGRRDGVPAKLYEYLGTGRPLLAVAEEDSDTAWVLRQSGIPYRVVPPSKPAAMQQALLELVDVCAKGNTRLPVVDGRARFTRERLAGQLAAALNVCLVPHQVEEVAPAACSVRRNPSAKETVGS